MIELCRRCELAFPAENIWVGRLLCLLWSNEVLLQPFLLFARICVKRLCNIIQTIDIFLVLARVSLRSPSRLFKRQVRRLRTHVVRTSNLNVYQVRHQ